MVQEGHDDVVDLLLEEKADLELKDKVFIMTEITSGMQDIGGRA